MSPMNPQPPVEIRLSSDRARLTLVWEDGTREALAAPLLRSHSQSAGEKRLRLMGLAAPAPADIVLTDVSVLGNYGLNLSFSDGHDRGIYPWALLKEIAHVSGEKGETDFSPANAIP
ncbi:gamma-butyrobetaine hydroxylase-like domain-containing protein [Xanthobacter variabilis]|uniref:gamma-butyrobetaine hydroxylase-like domain-containing protein n=1 Tax=Xanthobacter variabilis TaxID=3119932 RepID=UPI0037269020